MSAPYQERLKEALYEASARVGADRDHYLDALQAESADLAREVRSLLEERTHPGVEGEVIAAAAARAFQERARLPEAGREIGPYRLIELIGTGGMGAVYRAEQREPIRREVALKLLVGGTTLGRIADRFAAERRALSLLEHPGIARILDAGTDATGTSYIAMELVPGMPVTRYVREKDLGEEGILDLFVSICRAVQHAHQKGVVHRDLKPSNILVTEVDGRPAAKIIDFGIARIVEGEGAGVSRSLLTAEGQVIGTLEYMSPEQAEGRSREVDTQADVYSLGVLLYELLARALPYDLAGRSLTQAIEAIRHEPPRPFAATRAEGKAIASDLETITRKALEKDPARRYESAGALADDVERYRRAEPIMARPPSTAYQLRMLVRRHRGAVAVVGTAFAGLVVFGVTMAVLYAGQRRERERAESETRKAEAVSEFLQRMLASANPEEMGRDVTVREVMDQALRTMGTSMVRHSDVRASVEATLGRTYFSLGEWKLADSLTLVAYERMRAARGERSVEAIALLRERANVASQRKQIAAADSLGRRALRLAESVLGPRSLEAARCLRVLGNVWFETAPAKAESLLLPAVSIAEEHGSAGSRLREDAMVILAESMLRLSRYAEAESTHLRVIRSLERSAGDRAPRTLEARRNLGDLYLQTGRWESARGILAPALEAALSNFGADHPMTAAFMNDLAVAEIYLRSYARAESLQLATVRIWLRSLGEAHPYVSIGYQNLGYIAHCRMHYDDAITWYRKAIAVQHSDDPRDVEHLTAHANLAHALCDQGRWREALPVAERLEAAMAFRDRAKRSEYGKPDALDACGWAFYDAGQYTRALAHMQRAYDVERSEPRFPERESVVRANLALVRYRLDDRDTARLWLEDEAFRIMREIVTPPPKKRTVLRRLLAHFRETGQDSLVRACRVALDAIPR